MSKRLCLVLCAIITAAGLLAACTSADATPTTVPATPTTAAVQPTSTVAATTALVQPTTAPAATTAVPTTTAAQSDDATIKVGLVTNTNGANDQGFNQLAWAGVQKAAAELGFEAKVSESSQPTDYETNIDAFASEGYDVIITVGPLMGDATALKARQYPNIKFAIVDHAYTDGGLTNVTSLMFAEEQMGFLAGVLAGGMSRSGFVCSVSSLKTAASDRYIISLFGGAGWQGGEGTQFMNNYINIQTTDENVPTSTDATEGKDTAQRLIDAGCDVVLGVAANGALLAAKENNLMAIGFDVDQYNTYPEAKDALISSTQKNVDVAVYNYLKTVADGSVKAGISTGNLQNGGVGLAPFHDWDSKIPAELKDRIQQASDGIRDSSITIDLPDELK
jgi:basic membrane protein A